MRRSPRSRTTAAAPSISAGSPRSPTTIMTALEPVQWPLPVGSRGTRTAGPSLLRRRAASITQDRKARFIAPEPPAPRAATSDDFPLRLNTGRLRDQWHTMTRSGQSPRLGAHSPEPFVEMHPPTPRRTGLTDGGFARSRRRMAARAAQGCHRQRGTAARIDFRADSLERCDRSAARVGDLVMPEIDPLSGQPDAKATPAASRRSPSPIAALR